MVQSSTACLQLLLGGRSQHARTELPLLTPPPFPSLLGRLLDWPPSVLGTELGVAAASTQLPLLSNWQQPVLPDVPGRRRHRRWRRQTMIPPLRCLSCSFLSLQSLYVPHVLLGRLMQFGRSWRQAAIAADAAKVCRLGPIIFSDGTGCCRLVPVTTATARFHIALGSFASRGVTAAAAAVTVAVAAAAAIAIPTAVCCPAAGGSRCCDHVCHAAGRFPVDRSGPVCLRRGCQICKRMCSTCC